MNIQMPRYRSMFKDTNVWFDLSTVFYPEVGGSTLDSHHGFVVLYGIDKDVDLGERTFES